MTWGMVERAGDMGTAPRVRLFDIPTLVYIAFLMGVTVVYWHRLAHPMVYLAFLAILALNVLLWIWQPPRQAIPALFRQFYLVAYMPLFFTAMHYYIPALHQQDYDPILIQWDYALLGVHPTVFLERVMSPWLTEYLQLAYTAFYFCPAVLIVVLVVQRKRQALDYYLTLLAIAFFISYIGYLLVPALGPRFYLAHLQTRPLEGVYLFSKIQHVLNELENIQWDAFPSGHTAIILLVVYFAYYHFRRFFWVMIPISVSLIFSTVYLRYHYVVDVIGGILLALISIGLTRWLAQRPLFAREFSRLR